MKPLCLAQIRLRHVVEGRPLDGATEAALNADGWPGARAILESVNRRRLVRYLLSQSCLSAAVGFVFGGMMLAADINGIRTMLSAGHPSDAVIVLGSAVMIFFPVVMATSIGLLAWERDD